MDNQIVGSANAAPKISVLMPAYNAEKFVAEALESILAQTFSDFEFIIINDGSTDNTAKIIRLYKDPRIIFIDNKENQGLIAVLNQGLGMARGEYIARMDADDIAYPERFVKQARFLDENHDVGVVAANIRIFGDKFGELGDKRNNIVEYPGLVGALDWFRGCLVSHPAVMLRKDVFDKYELRYDPCYVACEDYELWTRAVRYTKIANIQEVLLNYRWHNGSITVRQNDIQMKNTQRVRDNIWAFCIHDEEDKMAYRFFVGGSDDALHMKVRLFGFIPLLTIKAQRNSKKIFLFDFIPIAKVRKRKIYLLFVLPIAKIVSIR